MECNTSENPVTQSVWVAFPRHPLPVHRKHTNLPAVWGFERPRRNLCGPTPGESAHEQAKFSFSSTLLGVTANGFGSKLQLLQAQVLQR